MVMPSSPGYKRNYRQEYDRYQGKPSQIKRRTKRNAAARKAGSLGDGLDVDHKDGNPKNNSKSNLRKTSPSSNRSFPRNKNAGKK
jgi:hypothetical protein